MGGPERRRRLDSAFLFSHHVIKRGFKKHAAHSQTTDTRVFTLSGQVYFFLKTNKNQQLEITQTCAAK